MKPTIFRPTPTTDRGPRMDGIPPALLTGSGLTGVLAGLIWALIRGWIVVGSVHREQLDDKDAQITRLWATVESLTDSVRKYAVAAETSAYALHQVEKVAHGRGGDDG